MRHPSVPLLIGTVKVRSVEAQFSSDHISTINWLQFFCFAAEPGQLSRLYPRLSIRAVKLFADQRDTAAMIDCLDVGVSWQLPFQLPERELDPFVRLLCHKAEDNERREKHEATFFGRLAEPDQLGK